MNCYLHKSTCQATLRLYGACRHDALIASDVQVHPHLLVVHRDAPMGQSHISRAGLRTPFASVFVEVTLRGVYQGQCALHAFVTI